MFDLVAYICICLLLSAAGLGLMHLLRIRIEPGIALLLGISSTQAMLACVLGLTVIAGLPIKRVAVPLWGGIAGLAIIGAWRFRADWRSVDARRSGFDFAVPLWLVGLGAAPLVMLPYFVHGLMDYPGSGFLDGWAYSALGQYFWEFGRNTEGGLNPLYQFAVHLTRTRVVSCAELSVLSALTVPGDVESAAGLLQALAVAGFACAAGAFARVCGFTRRVALLYVILSSVSGWMLMVLWANNYDQGQSLQYFPVVATLAILLCEFGPGGTVFTGIVSAGVIYTYPEFAALALSGAALLGVEAAWKRGGRTTVRTLAVAAPVTAIVAGTLVLPYWHDMRIFVMGQIGAGLHDGRRPGAGIAGGLLESGHLPSGLFALGGEHLTSRGLLLTNALGALLLVACALGIWHLIRRRQVGLVLLAFGFWMMAGTLLWRDHYDYGAYKALSLGWWITSFTILTGALSMVELFPRARKLAWIAAGSIVLIVPAVTTGRTIWETAQPVEGPISDYRAVERTLPLIGNAPVALFSTHVQAQHWGTYFLRRTKLFLVHREGYLGAPHLHELMQRTTVNSPIGIRLVITDATPPVGTPGRSWHLLWAAGAFALWDTGTEGWAAVAGVHDALNREIEPNPYFHAGPPGARVHLLANRAGELALSTRLFSSFAPDDVSSCWWMRIQPANGAPRELHLRPGAVRVMLSVPAGSSDVTIEAGPVRPFALPAKDEEKRVSGLADLGITFDRIEQTNGNALADYRSCDGS